MTPALSVRKNELRSWRKVKVAFVATAFGFGPVSKAATIARELKTQLPGTETHFFGGGIDHEFAAKNLAFDQIYKVHTNTENLEVLIPLLRDYDFVVCSMNSQMLPLWDSANPPLFFVDSLAWMWDAPPVGIGNANTYFAQNFAPARAHIADWRGDDPVILVPPILSGSSLTNAIGSIKPRENRLLVNLAGCDNPFVDATLFVRYATVLACTIADEALGFDEILVCCSQNIADRIALETSGRPTIKAGHLAHRDFLELLVTSRMLLTAPGITTTLEAVRGDIPFSFLLPQNDSQAIVSEIYRQRIGDDACMAFSSFGEQFSFPAAAVNLLYPLNAVKLAADHLGKILENHQGAIKHKIRLLLHSDASSRVRKFFDGKSLNCGPAGRTGQRVIVEHILERLSPTFFCEPIG